MRSKLTLFALLFMSSTVFAIGSSSSGEDSQNFKVQNPKKEFLAQSSASLFFGTSQSSNDKAEFDSRGIGHCKITAEFDHDSFVVKALAKKEQGVIKVSMKPNFLTSMELQTK